MELEVMKGVIGVVSIRYYTVVVGFVIVIEI